MSLEYLEALKLAASLGGSTLIALSIILCVYKLVASFGKAFIEAHQAIAQSLGAQAKCLTEMSSGIDRFINKDNTEHREILLGMQVVGDELKSLVCLVRELREERK